MLFAHRPGGLEQVARSLHLDIGAAEFAVMAALDLAAELGGHGHLAVADAEHGNAGIEDQLRGARRAFLVHGLRAAGEDHRFRLHLLEGGFGLLERHDLGIDALLAHPARDQLRHLTAEIDNQNLVMRRGHWLASTRGLSVGLSWQADTRRGAASQPGKSPVAGPCQGHPRLLVGKIEGKGGKYGPRAALDPHWATSVTIRAVAVIRLKSTSSRLVG